MMDIQADYYSFSDQDDYWYPDKLKTAVETLKSIGKSMSLYCCNQNCVDSSGNFLYTRFPNDFNERSVIATVLKNFYAGCTMVVDGELRDAIVKDLPPLDFFDLILHDTWISCVATVIGNVYFDVKPYMDFRRHEGTFSEETVGGNRNKSLIKLYLGKLHRLKKITLKKKRVASKRAYYIIEKYDSYLSNEDRRDLIELRDYSNSFNNRLVIMCNKRIRDACTNSFLLYVEILFNIL
jgi:rhamnosyltransferase